ncbi:interferon regulatory factor 5 isoform X1 [Takifugu flavidus]|uniref:interferon regulatory factor 5 isoform X1 n=1 Tax=Takifugu flavidus TaxID=433684 RepID=UPI002544BF37|nr:interferon regulatory factor 5 isoform X1 [Takifugu flavidus]XP_056878445.1 interferon regulatory factor 5 isoform X1 [Takifugu flavidus]
MSFQPRRIRLKPWLLAQVNSGRYPGLQWVSQDHRLFQIPWKHATRHTPASEEEVTIFKAWALETGKYQEGVDEPDPAKWKANLRCALNKSREFQLKYDGTKETPVHPYKIYEVCEQPGNADVGEEEDEEMPNLMHLTIGSASNSAYPAVPDVSRISLGTDGSFGSLRVTSDLPSQMETDSSFVPSIEPPNGLQDFSVLPAPASSALPDPLELGTMGDIQNLVHPQNQQTCKYDLLSSIPLTDLDLKFQYRGRMMGSQNVSNPQGCRLYYGHMEPTPEQVDLFGPVTLQQVQFPGTSDIQNHKQRQYTETVLGALERGLILEIWEQDIYAMRLCQSKVFWSGPGVPEQGPPNPMEREERVKVFSLNHFLEGLIRFQKGDAPNPPPFEIYFCFGEDWPDRRPKEKKLIVVQVVPVVARILTEMFSGELNWSTDSVHLRISNPDIKDQTVEQFKELQRLMQSQNITGPWTLNIP